MTPLVEKKNDFNGFLFRNFYDEATAPPKTRSAGFDFDFGANMSDKKAKQMSLRRFRLVSTKRYQGFWLKVDTFNT